MRRNRRLWLNIASNYAGNFWTAALALATIPICIRFMGVAAFGLVGFYAGLQAVVNLLDGGLSTTLNRGIAAASAGAGEVGSDSDVDAGILTRTLETAYWLGAAAIGASIWLLAPLFARDWIHGGGLTTMSVATAVALLGLAIALEFPFFLYSGGLTGLERQVELNMLVVVTATMGSAGSVLVLWLVSPTIEAFFVWQCIVCLLRSVAAGIMLWIYLPANPFRARFSVAKLRSVARFSADLGFISILAALLTQLPRLELSKILDLRSFGYFSIALVVSSGLYYFVTPIFQAVFPRLTRLVETGDEEAVARLYHHACQLVSVIVVPVALTLALFAPTVLTIWTQNPSVGSAEGTVLALLVAGTALHALYWVPYALQLANGWTKLALYLDAGAVVTIIPLTVVLAVPFGAQGAAVGWMALNLGCVMVQVAGTQWRYLPTDGWKWVVQDTVLPLLAASAVIVPCWLVGRLAGPLPLTVSAPEACALAFAAMLAATLMTPGPSRWLRRALSSRRLVPAGI